MSLTTLHHRLWLLLCVGLLAACQAETIELPTLAVLPTKTATATASNTPTPTFTALVSDTPTALPPSTTPTPSLTPSHTPQPTATPTQTLTPTFEAPATPLDVTPVTLLRALDNVTVYTVARANVRVCPSLDCEVLEQLTPNVEVLVLALAEGQAISGRDQWYLRALGGGYLHISLVSLTPPD